MLLVRGPRLEWEDGKCNPFPQITHPTALFPSCKTFLELTTHCLPGKVQIFCEKLQCFFMTGLGSSDSPYPAVPCQAATPVLCCSPKYHVHYSSLIWSHCSLCPDGSTALILTPFKANLNSYLLQEASPHSPLTPPCAEYSNIYTGVSGRLESYGPSHEIIKLPGA